MQRMIMTRFPRLPPILFSINVLLNRQGIYTILFFLKDIQLVQIRE